MTKLFRGIIPRDIKDNLIEKRKRGLALDSIGWRLELYRVHLGLDAKAMSELIGISSGSYSELQSDSSKPSCDTILNIFNLSKNPVDIIWLLTGKK